MKVRVRREGDVVAVVAGMVARISPEQALSLSAQVLDAIDELTRLAEIPSGTHSAAFDPEYDSTPGSESGLERTNLAGTPGFVVVKVAPLELTLTAADAVELAKDIARIADHVLTELEAADVF